jgi:hypothetical protein
MLLRGPLDERADRYLSLCDGFDNYRLRVSARPVRLSGVVYLSILLAGQCLLEKAHIIN